MSESPTDGSPPKPEPGMLCPGCNMWWVPRACPKDILHATAKLAICVVPSLFSHRGF